LGRRIAMMVIMPCLLAAAGGAAEHGPEGPIKAAIVYSLARTVTWPDEPAAGPFVIGLAGRDDDGPDFAVLAGKEVRGQHLEVAAWPTVAPGRIVFISRTESDRLGEILAAVGTGPVLTVSELDGFCRGGGMVQLVRDRNRMRLVVNRAAAEAAGLRLSSQLLKVAELWEEGR
jgi:hypothetical protein